MDGINWNGLVQRSNPFSSLSEGFQAGTDMRRDRERDAMLRQKQAADARALARTEALDNENRLERGIIGNMAGKDPRAAAAKALEVGQFDLAEQLGKLDEGQRKAARERAEDLGGFAATLAQQPYEARKAIIQQAAPILQELGFKPEQITGFDPSDQALQALVASSTDLKTALEEANRKRDDARADMTAEEAKRHNRTLEGQGAARIGIARSNSARGWASHNERKKAGGFGTPGVGGVRIPDDDVEID